MLHCSPPLWNLSSRNRVTPVSIHAPSEIVFQEQSYSSLHSVCDVTHVMSSAAGRATVSHLAIIVAYIEFALNYAGFDSNYYYFMRFAQLWKSPNYANKPWIIPPSVTAEFQYGFDVLQI